MDHGTNDDLDAPRLDDLTAAEVRVLGCLIEKEATTPDNYPLTLNSLRNACNQSTSRDPVVDYDDREVETALTSLRHRQLTRTVHSTSNRAIKYRHVVPDAFGLEPDETAVLAVLMLRGSQTVGELKQRCDRQHSFESTDEVATVLERLAARDQPLVRHLERQPGQKDARWVHLLSPLDAGSAPPAAPAIAPPVEIGDLVVRDIAASDRAAVVALWERVGLTRPWNDPSADIDRRLACAAPGGILVAERDGAVVGAVMIGYDGHRGWMYYLGAHPSRGGVGRALVAVGEERLRAVGCPKIDLMIREDNVDAAEFYEAVGYSLDPVIVMSKRLVDGA
jgi:uncharacterized protein YceH (UPF0502 family)